MLQSRRVAVLLNIIFGIVFGVLIFRLLLGPSYNYPALYTRFVWILLYPVSVLRGFGNDYIYVLFYALFWLYVFAVRIVILEAPFAKTLLKTLIWMPLVAVPFLPFGIEYFSLARYITSISSYLLRLIPFIGLLVLLFLANRFYFDQKYLFAGVWALVNFLLVIVVITLADLLPTIKSQFFFHALGYRFALVNDFISGMPSLALFSFICLSVFYISIFERQFLRLPFKKPTLVSIITPVGILIALSLLMMIMRDDFRRYRYFDYQGGIATVYFAAYDDRQTLTFDDARFTLSSGRYSVFYPFGKFNIQDTLDRHVEDIMRMKIIEGLDYYRLERIMKILAYGPRDEVLHNKLQRLVSGGRYVMPEVFKSSVSYIERRYASPANDITVTGWMMLNGRPLGNTEFFVNKISPMNFRSVEPIWQGITDQGGKFQFTCYKDVELDDIRFGIICLASEKLIGKNIDYVKVVHPIPAFSEPNDYVLDTLMIQTAASDEQSMLHTLSVRTSSRADSFSLLLPYLEPGSSVSLTASVSSLGSIDGLIIDHQPPLTDTAVLERMIERFSNSRLYLQDSISTVEIQIN
jgi:hypothetical protein